MFAIRPSQPGDDESIKRLLSSSTAELRSVYVLNPMAVAAASAPSGTRLVALGDSHAVAGVAEYLIYPSALYVQGLAVTLSYRRQGVAAALLQEAGKIAAGMNLPTLMIKTIKETGNVQVFQRLAFHIVDERISERFVSPQGQPVTEVTLTRPVTRL